MKNSGFLEKLAASVGAFIIIVFLFFAAPSLYNSMVGFNAEVYLDRLVSQGYTLYADPSGDFHIDDGDLYIDERVLSEDSDSYMDATLEEDKTANYQGDLLWDSGGGTVLAKTSQADDTGGKVGVFSYSGNNEFANFRVTDYTGTVLYSNTFTDDVLGAMPDGWDEWDGGAASNWEVIADATHPTGRAVQQQTGGNFDNNCFCTEYTPPATDKYVISVDVKAHAAGLWVLGISLYQSAPGTFYYYYYINDDSICFANYGGAALLFRTSDITAAQDIWYTLKIIVDGQRMWGYIKTLAESDYHFWLTYNWGPSITVFEAPGPLDKPVYGTIKQMLFIKGDTDEITLKVYYDGDALPTINMPLSAFFNGDADTAYVTRYVSQPYAAKAYGRYIEIPYTNGIKVVLENTVDSDNTLWWHIGYRTKQPVLLGRYARLYGEYQTDTLTPLEWGEFADINGKGALYSVYMRMSEANDFNYMEGNVRIFVDGSLSPQLESSGCEDFVGNSFGWSLQACSDYVGVPYKHLGGTPFEVSHYRMFIRDAVPFDTGLKLQWQNGQEGEGVPGNDTTLTTCVLYYLDQ